MSTKVQAVPSARGRSDRPAREHRSYGIFVRDLVLECRIGAFARERRGHQRVRFNVSLSVVPQTERLDDRLMNVVSYDEVIKGIKRIVAKGHINLVETLAEEVAALCLADSRVRQARVSVEKLDVVAAAASVGVEIERWSSPIAAGKGAATKKSKLQTYTKNK